MDVVTCKVSYACNLSLLSKPLSLSLSLSLSFSSLSFFFSLPSFCLLPELWPRSTRFWTKCLFSYNRGIHSKAKKEENLVFRSPYPNWVNFPLNPVMIIATAMYKILEHIEYSCWVSCLKKDLFYLFGFLNVVNSCW